MAKYRLRLKTLTRISAVDRPAQPTANVRLIKREDANLKDAPVGITGEYAVVKLDDDLRLVFGYGFTSTKDGEPYHDLQGDHVVSDDEMIKAALDFVATGARADAMHDHVDRGGSIPFVMPLTPEIAKAFGLDGGEVGLMIGMRPDEETYAKFKSGEYTAFSIDGTGDRELVEDDDASKSAWMTTDVDGHAHLIDDIDFDGHQVNAGSTSWSTSEGDEHGHEHPWLKNLDGSLTIGASDGHTHGLLVTKIQTQAKNPPKAEPKPVEPVQKEQDEMPNTPDLQKNVDELTEKLNKALAFGSLSDAEKAYHANLPSDERDAWVAKSRAVRADDVAKAAASDEVIFKSADGTEYRKSDDQRLVKMAQERDADAKTLAVEVAKRELVELEKRAEDEAGNLTGTIQVRAAMLKALDGITDDDTRKAALDSIKGASDSLARMYETVGEHPRGNPTDSSASKLDALAKKRADEKSEPFGVAYNKVLETEEGASLYAEIRAN